MKLIFFLLPFLALPILISVYADSTILNPVEERSNEPRYFAKIENNVITNVIVADPEFVLNHMEGEWVETWKKDDNPRKRYAGIGYTYNKDIESFVPPKVFSTWNLNQTNGLWDPPTPKPGEDYVWDEKVPDWARKK